MSSVGFFFNCVPKRLHIEANAFGVVSRYFGHGGEDAFMGVQSSDSLFLAVPSSIQSREITALAIRCSVPRLIGADKSDAITPHVESIELDGHPGDTPVIAVRPSLRLVTSPISSPHFHPNQIGQSMEVFRLSAAIGAHFEPLLDYSVAIVAFDALFQKYEWDRHLELSEECAKQSLLLHKQLSQIWKDRQRDPLKNLTPQLWVDLILHLGTVFDSTMHALRFVLFRMPHCSDLFSL